MTKENVAPTIEKWLIENAGERIPELNDWDYACCVLGEIDYDSQLQAIKELIRYHKDRCEILIEGIREIESEIKNLHGNAADHASDILVDKMYMLNYQDAAHGMAAVGMLTSFIEAIYCNAFCEIKEILRKKNIQISDNDLRGGRAQKKYWDYRFYWEDGKNKKSLVEGILQLSKAIGLDEYMPCDICLKLNALVKYRNAIFHNGFEWSIAERTKFVKAISDNEWSENWFPCSRHDNEPWIYYIADDFVLDCISMVERIIEAIGAYAKKITQIQVDVI